jgi:hypothetical protein
MEGERLGPNGFAPILAATAGPGNSGIAHANSECEVRYTLLERALAITLFTCGSSLPIRRSPSVHMCAKAPLSLEGSRRMLQFADCLELLPTIHLVASLSRHQIRSQSRDLPCMAVCHSSQGWYGPCR